MADRNRPEALYSLGSGRLAADSHELMILRIIDVAIQLSTPANIIGPAVHLADIPPPAPK